MTLTGRYLLYEGANSEPADSRHLLGCWDDSIGLARSSDLVHWTTDSALELAIAQQPGPSNGVDAVWTGWPRAIERGEHMFVFYAAGGAGFDGKHHFADTAVRRIALEDFVRWDL